MPCMGPYWSEKVPVEITELFLQILKEKYKIRNAGLSEQNNDMDFDDHLKFELLALMRKIVESDANKRILIGTTVPLKERPPCLSLAVCKKCSRFTETVDIGYRGVAGKVCFCDFKEILRQEKNGKLIFSQDFKVPKDCPYQLEHMVKVGDRYLK